jgi:translation initiation factor 5B
MPNIMTTSNSDQLRAPICGIFGHVDSGKTSFLNKLKSFESTEAGGITQETNTIFITIKKIKELSEELVDLKQILVSKNELKEEPQQMEIKIPGILFIDTPGHEAFVNFRKTAIEICDMGIVIVDIENGIENQTIDSIKLLKENKIPFIIILTKLDKVYNWQSTSTTILKNSIKEQSQETTNALMGLIEGIKYELDKIQVNSEFYFKNKTPGKTYSIIPVSNLTGEGFNDLINFMLFIVQNFMNKKLTLVDSKPKIFIMDKFFDQKLGWTINAILSNGILKTSQTVVFNSQSGPIQSIIRNIIGLKWDDSKCKYIRCNQNIVEAANSVYIFAPNLENVLPGSFLYSYDSDTEYQQLVSSFKSQEVKKSYLDKIKSNELGHYMFTSTENEFEAGYEVFKSSSITITNGSIGPLNEKAIDDFHIVLDNIELDEYRIMIYYTNSIKKAKKLEKLIEYAKTKNIFLIFNDVIYKLVDDFNTLKNKIILKRKDKYVKDGKVQLPAELKLLKQFVFMRGGATEILCGFKVLGGKISIGTEIICTHSDGKEPCVLGKIIKMEKNHKEILEGKMNDEICIKFDNPNKLVYQKHWDENDIFYSKMTRPGVELLKRDFRSDLNKEEWLLTAKIVKSLKI